MTTPTYPDVTVTLTDGNAFAIIGTVSKAIRQAHGPDAADTYRAQAMACGDYDELLRHAMTTVEVD